MPAPLINITPEHFNDAAGNAVLGTGGDGEPVVVGASKVLGSIALVMYENCQQLSRAEIDLVVSWARQYKYLD